MDSTDISYDDWLWGLTKPDPIYTVFNYQTGLSLESKNKLGVKVTRSKWKFTYYPKQYFIVHEQEAWYRAYKTINYSFTVTYPKKCKDVCIGIGFVNKTENIPDMGTFNEEYWKGKQPYGKTDYYKNGKSTMSYMRLNK